MKLNYSWNIQFHEILLGCFKNASSSQETDLGNDSTGSSNSNRVIFNELRDFLFKSFDGFPENFQLINVSRVSTKWSQNVYQGRKKIRYGEFPLVFLIKTPTNRIFLPFWQHFWMLQPLSDWLIQLSSSQSEMFTKWFFGKLRFSHGKIF